MARKSWLDESAERSLIDDYVSKMESFTTAMADGRVDNHELEAQEKRLLSAMKLVEGKLDDSLHAEVTTLLCELTAYNVMQMLSNIEQARPHPTFVG